MASLCHVDVYTPMGHKWPHKALGYMPGSLRLPVCKAVGLTSIAMYGLGRRPGLYFRLPIDLRSIRPTVAYGYIGYIRSLRMFSNVCDVVWCTHLRCDEPIPSLRLAYGSCHRLLKWSSHRLLGLWLVWQHTWLISCIWPTATAFHKPPLKLKEFSNLCVMSRANKLAIKHKTIRL